MTLWIAVATLLSTIAGTLVLVSCRHKSSAGEISDPIRWLDDLSLDRYRPMLRLLDHRDLDFLRRQPGFTPRLAARFRKQRCRIFRGYLGQLQADFCHICSAVKVLMLQSSVDRPDLAGRLLRTQAAFTWGVLAVQARVALYRCGVGTVDISGLLAQFDAMREQMTRLIPAAIASAA
jgi:hypothetical protein